MDADSLKKEQTLLKIREDAAEWLNPSPDKFVQYHENCIAIKSAEVTGTKFINDHTGYVLAIGELSAHKRALEAYRTANDRAARADKELKDLKAANGED